MKNFNDFCEKRLDRLYDSRFTFEEQCSGYKQLKLMVENNITPAPKEDCERWEIYPTIDELARIPENKYMRNIHPILREFIRENWGYIKTLEIDN